MSLADPPKIISCKALHDEILSVADGLDLEFVEARLHDVPDKLRATVQAAIDTTPGERTILLLYGRCSNGTAGLKAGPHRLVLPAVDDCISLLLGSRERYREEHQSQPGTYYYTRGWIEYIDDPYAEYKQIVPKYGEEKARRIALMIMDGYTRVALIDTGSYPIEQYEPYVREVSEFYNLPVEHLAGSLRYIEKLVKGPHDREFIVIEPGGVLEERIFWELDAS
jgi:hypothetical protein